MPKGHISRRCENGEVRTSPFLFRLHQKVHTQAKGNDFPCRKRHICKQHLASKLPIIGSAGKIENRRPQPVFSDKTAGRAGVKPGSGRQSSVLPALPDLASLRSQYGSQTLFQTSSCSLNTGIALAIVCYTIARAITVRRLAWNCGMVLRKSLRLPSLAWGKSITTMDRDSIAQRASTLQGNGHACVMPMALRIAMNSIWPISRYSTCYRRNIQFCIG